jgi:hypothetical protein
MSDVYAARLIDQHGKHYYFTGAYAGFISKDKAKASWAFTEEKDAKEMGDYMAKFLVAVVAGKFKNDPVKRKK